MWTIVLSVCFLAIIFGGLGVLVYVAKKNNSSNTNATTNTQNQQQTQAATPPNPPAPPQKWYENLDNLKWVGIIAGVILIPLILFPAEGIKILTLGGFLPLRIVFCFLVYGLIKHFFFPNAEAEKKQLLSVIRLIIIIAIAFQIYSYRETIAEKLPNGSFEGLGSKIGSFFTPVPPEEKWEGSTIIEAPVEDDWSKIPEVTALKWHIVEWKITAVAPNNQGRYEIMSEGWEKPFQAGGDGNYHRFPPINRNLRFKLRSLEKEPMKFKLQWR